MLRSHTCAHWIDEISFSRTRRIVRASENVNSRLNLKKKKSIASFGLTTGERAKVNANRRCRYRLECVICCEDAERILWVAAHSHIYYAVRILIEMKMTFTFHLATCAWIHTLVYFFPRQILFQIKMSYGTFLSPRHYSRNIFRATPRDAIQQVDAEAYA